MSDTKTEAARWTIQICPKCGQTMNGPRYCKGHQLHYDGCDPTPEQDFCADGEHLTWHCPCGWCVWRRPLPEAEPAPAKAPADKPPQLKEEWECGECGKRLEYNEVVGVAPHCSRCGQYHVRRVKPATPPAPEPAGEVMTELKAELDRLYEDFVRPSRGKGWMGTAVFIEAARADQRAAVEARDKRIAELEAELVKAKAKGGG
jgi:ssDNA-binding Zn-finger/Zn-ribbon topoisomerase 1